MTPAGVARVGEDFRRDRLDDGASADHLPAYAMGDCIDGDAGQYHRQADF